eukprot:14331.XXX_3856_3491_1 [CDS] Oithona nana genome sequencing.
MKLITFLILATSVALCCNALPNPQGSPQTSPPPSLGNSQMSGPNLPYQLID